MTSFLMRLKTSAAMVGVALALASLSAFIPSGILFAGALSALGALALKEWAAIARPPLTFLGGGAILAGIASLGWLYWCMGWQACFYVIAIAIFADTLGYLGGQLFGGPKLWPAVSPGKTWAGALTGLSLAPFGGYGVAVLLWPSVSFSEVFLSSGWLCLAAQGGDLLESAAKRYCRVKDTGSFLPGHGGMLDRIDSWLAAATAAVALSVPMSFQGHAETPFQAWVNKEGEIKEDKRAALLKLFEDSGLMVFKENAANQSHVRVFNSWKIAEINGWLQGHVEKDAKWFLPNVERWQMSNPLLTTDEQRLKVIQGAKEFLRVEKGLIPETLGEGILVMGSRVEPVYAHLHHLNKVLKDFRAKGKTIPPVYILTGPRTLLPEEKEFLQKKLIEFKSLPLKGFKLPDEKEIHKMQEESEAMELLAFCMLDLEGGKPIMIEGRRDPQRGRATTETTVEAWLDYLKKSQKTPVKSQTFVVSSQAPFIDSQWQNTQNIFDREYPDLHLITLGMGGPWLPASAPSADLKDKPHAQIADISFKGTPPGSQGKDGKDGKDGQGPGGGKGGQGGKGGAGGKEGQGDFEKGLGLLLSQMDKEKRSASLQNWASVALDTLSRFIFELNKAWEISQKKVPEKE